MFRQARWPETDGEPVCPECGCLDHWPLPNQKKFKCKAANCRKQFSITSGTVFAHHKLSYKDMLLGIRSFIKEAKGNTAISLSEDLGVTYKTAWVFQQKCREAITEEAKDIRLEGDVEIDGGWFGGYVKPENVKINRVDRRLAINRNGKRRVVVGARERGPDGRAIVAVFDSEDKARAWLIERIDRSARIFADGAPAWDEMSASHQVLTVNHDERYADGIINTNQMESFFSRLRRFEATHHHISGTYLHRYANDAAWRENNRKVDDRRRTSMIMRAAMKAPQSRSFSGYWQRGSANHCDNIFGDVFAGVA